MQRKHDMPFGAELTGDGVRFRLWAPTADRVDLCLAPCLGSTGDGIDEFHPMTALKDGWFELEMQAAGHGSRYRYRIDGGQKVPDPASRSNPDDVNAPSEVIDPTAYQWNDLNWHGLRWEDAVIYELHVGCFTEAGSFAAVGERLDFLIDLGVTAIELMPLADFPGARNWGYDGVLPFAPDSSYGRPEDLKALVDLAHVKGLMVMLDVVYNHFGPQGNYLAQYAPQFFSERHHTPWGAAINFDGAGSRTVRDFFIHNALYWLEEFHFDGLRLDAVHAIIDDSDPDILIELAEAVRKGPGREREIHLVLENDHNAAHYLERGDDAQPRWYTAQWNDDCHHALHVLATGETDGYYIDYAQHPLAQLGRCLTQGFAYQGDISHYRKGEPRGEVSANLPPPAFVNYLQTHDQIGNRAFGERLHMLADARSLRALAAIVLLAPSIPLLFMGEEFGARQPFQYFCNFDEPLATAVRKGRLREFGDFLAQKRAAEAEKVSSARAFAAEGVPEAGMPAADISTAKLPAAASANATIPDPCDVATFQRSKLDWSSIVEGGEEAEWLGWYRRLLAIRHASISPHLGGKVQANFDIVQGRGLMLDWRLHDNCVLHILANLGPRAMDGIARPSGAVIFASDADQDPGFSSVKLLPWSVVCLLDSALGPSVYG